MRDDVTRHASVKFVHTHLVGLYDSVQVRIQELHDDVQLVLLLRVPVRREATRTTTEEGLTPLFLYQVRVILGHTLLLARTHPSPSEEWQHMVGHRAGFNDLIVVEHSTGKKYEVTSIFYANRSSIYIRKQKNETRSLRLLRFWLLYA